MYRLAMSIKDFTKLIVLVLLFQQVVYSFVYWYWCYELICNGGYCISAKKV